MLSWVECETLDIDLDLPVAQRLRVHYDRVEASAKELLRAIRLEMPPNAKYAAYLINLRTRGRYWREARAASKIVGADWREILAAALSYEFVVGIFACSTMALATVDGPVLARNMDFWPEQALARASRVIRCFRRGKLMTIVAGWPGAMGAVTGMSARGFAIALNAVASPGGLCRTGYPVMLYLREVLERADSFRAAVDMLSTQRLMAGALFTVVGTSNDQRIVIERTPRAVEHRVPSDDRPLIATNSYQKLVAADIASENEILATSCGRYEALQRICDSPSLFGRNVSDEAILFALTEPQVLQRITAQHVIMRPCQNTLRLFVPRRLLDQDAAES